MLFSIWCLILILVSWFVFVNSAVDKVSMSFLEGYCWYWWLEAASIILGSHTLHLLLLHYQRVNLISLIFWNRNDFLWRSLISCPSCIMSSRNSTPLILSFSGSTRICVIKWLFFYLNNLVALPDKDLTRMVMYLIYESLHFSLNLAWRHQIIIPTFFILLALNYIFILVHIMSFMRTEMLVILIILEVRVPNAVTLYVWPLLAN